MLMRISVSQLATPVLFFLCINANAQLKLPVTNNDLRNNLSKVISDYVEGFASLKSDTIIVNPQSIEFTTKLDFPGCEANSITEYLSKKPSYSWEAVLLTSEDFEEASKKYKWLFTQLKLATITVQNHPFALNGDFDVPDERKKFCASIFTLTSSDGNLFKLKVEATMQFEFPQWKVNLLVYGREREDNERGDINAD